MSSVCIKALLLLILVVGSYGASFQRRYTLQSEFLAKSPGNEEWAKLLKYFINAVGFSDVIIQKNKDKLTRIAMSLENELQEIVDTVTLTKFELSHEPDDLPTITLTGVNADESILEIKLDWNARLDLEALVVCKDKLCSTAMRQTGTTIRGTIFLQLPSNTADETRIGWYVPPVVKLTTDCQDVKLLGHWKMPDFMDKICTVVQRKFNEKLEEYLISPYDKHWVQLIPTPGSDDCSAFSHLQACAKFAGNNDVNSATIQRLALELDTYLGTSTAVENFLGDVCVNLPGYHAYLSEPGEKKPPVQNNDHVCFCQKTHEGGIIHRLTSPIRHAEHKTTVEDVDGTCPCLPRIQGEYHDPMIGGQVTEGIEFTPVKEVAVNEYWSHLIQKMIGVVLFPANGEHFYFETINNAASDYIANSNALNTLKLTELHLPPPTNGPVVSMLSFDEVKQKLGAQREFSTEEEKAFPFIFSYKSDGALSATFHAVSALNVMTENVRIKDVTIEGIVLIYPPEKSLFDLKMKFITVPTVDIDVEFENHAIVGGMAKGVLMEVFKWVVNKYAVQQWYQLSPLVSSAMTSLTAPETFCESVTFVKHVMEKELWLDLKLNGKDTIALVSALSNEMETRKNIVKQGNDKLEDLKRLIETKLSTLATQR